MKKIFVCLLTAFITFAIPSESNATVSLSKTEFSIPPIYKENLRDKLNEIRIPEKSITSNSQEKKLAKEIRSTLQARGFFINITICLLLLVIIALLVVMMM
jgi:hypothetical protein